MTELNDLREMWNAQNPLPEDFSNLSKTDQREVIAARNQKFGEQVAETHPEHALHRMEHNALMWLAANNRKKSTEVMVERIGLEYRIYTTRDDKTSEMWIYQEGIYVPNARTYIREVVRHTLKEAYRESIANEVIAKIEADTYVDADKFFNSPDKYKVVVENGIINIVTLELEPHTPDQVFFNKLPVKYDKTKDCPKILSFFDDVLAHPEDDVKVMQELFGYVLLKEYKYEKSFMFFGTGRNGKGKTFELLRALVGNDNCVSVTLQDLDEKEYSPAQLFKKLVNIGGDISGQTLKETAMFKACTGRDLITANRKYLSAVKFVNYAKMVFAANTLPRIYDNTPGFWERWEMLDFPYKFIPQFEYEKLPEEEKSRHKVQDPEIIERIMSEDELSGLLNWALAGLARLIENKRFSTSMTSQQVRSLWMRRSDSFLAFCMDHVEQDWEGRVPKDFLRQQYSLYCRKNKVPSVSDKAIKSVLVRDFGVGEERERTNGNDVYFWTGVVLKDIAELSSTRRKSPAKQVVPITNFEPTDDCELVLVDVLKDCPQFMVNAEESIGPFKWGDQVKIPRSALKALTNRGYVSEVTL